MHGVRRSQSNIGHHLLGALDGEEGDLTREARNVRAGRAAVQATHAKWALDARPRPIGGATDDPGVRRSSRSWARADRFPGAA